MGNEQKAKAQNIKWKKAMREPTHLALGLQSGEWVESQGCYTGWDEEESQVWRPRPVTHRQEHGGRGEEGKHQGKHTDNEGSHDGAVTKRPLMTESGRKMNSL